MSALDENKKALLNEAVELERTAAELYRLYSELFIEDKAFWYQLSEEEVRHAALIGTAIDFFEHFPEEIASGDLGSLKKVNEEVSGTIAQYREVPPSKQVAYQYAFELESKAFELHFQKLTEKSSEDVPEIARLQKLNADDKDHAERIKELIGKSA